VPPGNYQPCPRSSYRGLASYDNKVKIGAAQGFHVSHDERLTDPEQAWGLDPEDPARLQEFRKICHISCGLSAVEGDI
jgi:hypothetical protein